MRVRPDKKMRPSNCSSTHRDNTKNYNDVKCVFTYGNQHPACGAGVGTTWTKSEFSKKVSHTWCTVQIFQTPNAVIIVRVESRNRNSFLGSLDDIYRTICSRLCIALRCTLPAVSSLWACSGTMLWPVSELLRCRTWYSLLGFRRCHNAWVAVKCSDKEFIWHIGQVNSTFKSLAYRHQIIRRIYRPAIDDATRCFKLPISRMRLVVFFFGRLQRYLQSLRFSSYHIRLKTKLVRHSTCINSNHATKC